MIVQAKPLRILPLAIVALGFHSAAEQIDRVAPPPDLSQQSTTILYNRVSKELKPRIHQIFDGPHQSIGEPFRIFEGMNTEGTELWVEGVGDTLFTEFDMQEGQGTAAFLPDLKRSLAGIGFTSIFSCSGLQCRPALEWQIELSANNTGPSESQDYQLLARYPIADAFLEYVVIYTNRTGCCNRASIQIIQVEKIHWANRLLKRQKDGSVAFNGIVARFEPGSSELNSFSQDLLNTLAQQIDDLVEADIWIKGESDPSGSKASNRELEKQRTLTTMKALRIEGEPKENEFLHQLRSVHHDECDRQTSYPVEHRPYDGSESSYSNSLPERVTKARIIGHRCDEEVKGKESS